MKSGLLFILTGLILLPVTLSALERTHAPADATAYIISPANGARVLNPVTVRFGLKGMGIAPAGAEFANTGHFHILLDEDKLPDVNQPMPVGDHYLHYSDGQIEVSLDLSPGKHTLQLIMGDYRHIPHKPPIISKKITIIVEKLY